MLNILTAKDVLQHIYPGTLEQAIKDVQYQVEDGEKFILTHQYAAASYLDEVHEKIEEHQAIAKALLEYYVSYSACPSQYVRIMCKKYNIELNQ